MKITFDTEACKKNGKDIDLILYLVSLFAGAKITPDTFEKARQQNLLKFNKPYDRNNLFPTYVELSQDGEFLVESIMADSFNGTKKSMDDRFIKLAMKMQELFPEGNKPGYSMKWRDSTSCIADRLKKFFLKFKCTLDIRGVDYSDEAILRATKSYISSFNGNYQYMQTLKYFIWKNKRSGEELVDGRIIGETELQSQLAAWLENSEEKPSKADWDIELK